MYSTLTNCPSCGAKPGQIHEGACTVERCSKCEDHLFGGCECETKRDYDKALARWTGFMPGVTEAEKLSVDLT